MADPSSGRPISGGRSVHGRIRLFSRGTPLGQRFEVRRVLGAGGGATYSAFDNQNAEPVVLKVLPLASVGLSALARLGLDAARVRAARNPHLVPILEIQRAGDAVYVVREEVAGDSLDRKLENGPLPMAEALAIAKRVLAGLAALHECGVLHRALKPANVFLTPSGVRIADFGLERLWEKDPVASERAAAYLAPEQAAGREIDERADLFAAGALLFEMLTGEPPRQGASPLDTVRMTLKEKPKDVRELLPEVPHWLAKVVSRLLARERDARYASAHEALRDLKAERATAVPLTFWRRPILLALETLAAGALTLAFFRWQGNLTPSVRLFADLDTGTLRVYDTRGRELWSKDGIQDGRSFALVRRGGWERAEVAAILPHYSHDRSAPRAITFFDREDGRPRFAVTLPSGAPRLGLSEAAFSLTELRALDRDDGFDTLLATFEAPSGASYAVLHDLATSTSRVVLVSYDPYTYVASADVDNDGAKELLFSGTARNLGGHLGVAAVRAALEPLPEDAGAHAVVGPRPIAQPAPADGRSEAAATPDAQPTPEERSRLAWFVLARPDPSGEQPTLRVNDARRALELFYATGRQKALDFSGFFRSDATAVPTLERLAHRDAAYRQLVSAQALQARGFPRRAAEVARAAQEEARRAVDSILAQWCASVAESAADEAATAGTGRAE